MGVSPNSAKDPVKLLVGGFFFCFTRWWAGENGSPCQASLKQGSDFPNKAATNKKNGVLLSHWW